MSIVMAEYAIAFWTVREISVNLSTYITGADSLGNWTADTTIVQVLNSIWGLLLEPDTEDTANIILTQNYFSDREAYNKSVRDFAQKHAIKNRKQWKAEILYQ
ncbi:hypothetical protein RUND412_008438 [Rhizina undulata]